MRRVKIAGLGVVAVVAAVMFAGCGSNAALNQQRANALNDRASAYDRAVAQYPAPKTENFPNRATLVEMTKRDDMLNHPWYVYLLGQNGNIVGYYVAKSDPVNACDFLSSTENVLYDHGNVVTTAPSLDGIYYGGSGATAGCDAWVFLDYATNALVKIRGLAFYVADQPLKVAADPIRVGK